MYAERSDGRVNGRSMALALGINAGLVGALLFAAPDILPTPPRPPITGIDLTPPPEPLPPPPPPEAKAPPSETVRPIDAPLPPPPPERMDAGDPVGSATDGFTVAPGPAGVEGGVAGGTGAVAVDPPRPVPPPVFVGPGIDARYAHLLQPAYPASERRAGAQGRVVARVLVGTDGRVKAVERVLAASDAFWRATEDQSRRWRFTPATRDGVPVEAWRVMTLTFRLEDR